jgi:hypothetical protein
MILKFYSEFIIKSQYDPEKYLTDTFQFFYGAKEPYYLEEVEILSFPKIRRVFANTIGLDLVAVQPLAAPNRGLLDMLRSAADTINIVGRNATANYIIASPAIAEQLNNLLPHDPMSIS